MPYQYEDAILAEASSDASFLFLTVDPAQKQQVIETLKNIPQLVSEQRQLFPDCELLGLVGISIHGWRALFGDKPTPAELTEQPSLKGPLLSVRDIPYDLVLHIRSLRRDATHSLALTLYRAFRQSVTLAQQTDCFKYLDNRDFTGFVDGTENPVDDQRRKVALIDQDSELMGCSYLNLMEFVHNLPKWEAEPLKTQEDTYGRTKADNIEYASADKPLTAHTKRTSLKDENGNSLEILRHSMPFGNVERQGLMFASYSKTPQHFNKMLRSMVEGDDQGNVDHLMAYTQSEGASLFFVPSANFLHRLA
ncbi:Dyp-type peroxidase [Maribrevibacterium harenarium]|uniref:Dyp-type peroxidase n=1 Tax=Maribrevibacterium harenarium TaxID=2589817 RepID=A0A501WZ36_9GAMM|nr:Dyp-type peroxidase [Maribrevibacterium harenarium]TPE51306.1 Dyp-type peroxidase [Maribrevibacterium harenarium]